VLDLSLSDFGPIPDLVPIQNISGLPQGLHGFAMACLAAEAREASGCARWRDGPARRSIQHVRSGRGSPHVQHMKRREFISLIGSAAAWPFAAGAQSVERARRIGVLANFAESDAETQAMIGVLQQRLAELGWSVSRNLQIEARWSGGDPGRLPARAAELLALKPDVLIGTNTPAVAALRQVTEAVPIVFVNANDPIRLGFVQSLARPGGNITGFINWGSTIGGKWLELLTEIVPGLEHVALTFNPRTYTGQQTQSIEAAAPALRVGLTSVAFRDGSEIERALAEFSQTPNRGLLVLPDSSTVLHRDLIVGLAARHRIPAIYPSARSSRAAGFLTTERIRRSSTGRPPSTSTGFSREPSPLTCRCRRRPGMRP
jgi:putative tryptophan/tyrosine transport system substrate-binding protein